MSRLHIRNLLFFICVAFLAYLPLTSFLFALKNDAYTGYFPVKFFMSESLHAGYFPSWNPYLNYGLPMHGDLSGGFWNPITWLTAGTWGYNVYSYTFEEIFYLITGAVGMYQLTGYWSLQRFPRLIASIAYMCCGFNVGHLQHLNWISGAAFLPWCIDGYMRLMREYKLKKLLSTALSFYFLLASAHPGIIIGTAYLFLFLAIFHLIKTNVGETAGERIKRIGTRSLVLVCTASLLCFGIIYSVWEILPHITRGQKISLQDATQEPSTIQSWISLFFPFCTTKHDEFFNTDVSIRNSYVSVTLLIFFLFGIISTKDSWQKLFLSLAGFFFLLSSTIFFKAAAYQFLPLTGFVRLSGEFRIFTILAMIVFSAISLHKYLSGEKLLSKKLMCIFYLLAAIASLTFIFSLFKVLATRNSIIFQFDSISITGSTSSFLKQVIDKISFYDALLIQSFIQIIILYAIFRVLRAGNNRLILAVVIIDLILATLFNMPFTGVGQLTNPEVQAIINRARPGIPMPELVRTDSLETGDGTINRVVGNWSMYNKQIGTLEKTPYPINLKTTVNFFESKELGETSKQPFIFFADSAASLLSPEHFSPTELRVAVNSSDDNNLVYKQNYYPRWNYSMNGEIGKPGIFAGTFLQVPIPAGKHTVNFFYKDDDIKILLSLTAVAILFILCFLTYYGKKKKPSV